MQPPSGRFADPSSKERVFNAPVPAVLLALSLPVFYAIQERTSDFGFGLAFVPTDLAQGRYGGLFTSMLVHGGWPHVLMNAVGALIFGTPVARLFRGSVGLLVFLALYSVSGVFSTLGYGLMHLSSQSPLVGASGAVFGLIGASTRLLGGEGRVLPLADKGVVKTAIAWMVVNAVVGVIGFAPGMDGARIAWEAHAFGFLVGILAIGPLARLFAKPPAEGTGAPGPE